MSRFVLATLLLVSAAGGTSTWAAENAIPQTGDPGADYFAGASPDPESLPGLIAPQAVAPVSTEAFGAVASEADLSAAPPVKCDAKKMAALKKQVATAYKGLFYENNFGYLCDPCYNDFHLGEGLKRNCLGDWGVLDVGGQYRARLHNERHIRSFGLTGRNDDFLLHRTRLYANLEAGERVRVFAEYIDAESNYENFPPRNIEVNRSDLLNLFGDGKLLKGDCGDLWVRVGRQELLYGQQQRLVSPLDWANTRRTFEGVKAFWKGADWDLDAFWTRPVIVNPTHFDSPDQHQEFSGAYATYKGIENRTTALYALRYLDTDGPTPFEFNTFGGSLAGTEGAWLWDLEGAWQTGNYGASNHSAGFVTVGGGRKFDDHCWKPVLWAYYDWASGSNQIGNGFHHLFPLGHKYFGFMDLYGRRNIEDANFQLTFKPHEKLTVLAWHHVFFLENGGDVPYNINLSPFVTTAGGNKYLGQELDLLCTWQFHPRQDLVFGYSHFWHGSYYDTNPAVPFRGDADFFYTQYSINF